MSEATRAAQAVSPFNTHLPAILVLLNMADAAKDDPRYAPLVPGLRRAMEVLIKDGEPDV